MDHVKYAQTAYLMKRVAEFKKIHNLYDPAVIICGDFNSEPDSASVSLIYDDERFQRNQYAN